MGEAINLVNNFKIEKVIFNCGEYNELEKDLIKVLDKKKIKYYSCIKKLDMDNNKLSFGYFKALQREDYEKLMSGIPVKIDLSKTESYIASLDRKKNCLEIINR